MTAVTATRRALICCRGITVVHGRGNRAVTALAGVDVEVAAGDRLALLGRSGSGKTTLLHVLGGLVAPDEGRVVPPDAAATGRAVGAAGVAYVFQGANLLPHFTALENVAFAAHASGQADVEASATELLGLVGLAAKLDSLPAELSGGEAQRVAIARALAQRPDVLLCDEPTGHLDSQTGERVLDLVDALQAERGFGLVVATHDVDVAARMDRTVQLLDGRVVDESA